MRQLSLSSFISWSLSEYSASFTSYRCFPRSDTTSSDPTRTASSSHRLLGREESPDLLPELPYCPISTIHVSFTAYSQFPFQCVLLSKRVDARTRSMDSESVRHRHHTPVLPTFEPDQKRCRIRSGPLGHSNYITIFAVLHGMIGWFDGRCSLSAQCVCYCVVEVLPQPSSGGPYIRTRLSGARLSSSCMASVQELQRS